MKYFWLAVGIGLLIFVGWFYKNHSTVKVTSSVSSKLVQEKQVPDSSLTIKSAELETKECLPMKIEKTGSGYKGTVEIADTKSPMKASACFNFEANQPQKEKKPCRKPVVEAKKEKKVCPVVTPVIVQTPPKEQPKAVVNKEPTKLVIVRNDTDDCEVVIMETYPDGGFKRYQLMKNSDGTYRNVTPGGEHGIGVYPGSRELTLQVKVINKRGRVKYETRVTHFRFDASIDGQSRKEKYFWIIADRECRSSIYKDGEMQRNKRKRFSSIIEE